MTARHILASMFMSCRPTPVDQAGARLREGAPHGGNDDRRRLVRGCQVFLDEAPFESGLSLRFVVGVKQDEDAELDGAAVKTCDRVWIEIRVACLFVLAGCRQQQPQVAARVVHLNDRLAVDAQCGAHGLWQVHPRPAINAAAVREIAIEDGDERAGCYAAGSLAACPTRGVCDGVASQHRVIARELGCYRRRLCRRLERPRSAFAVPEKDELGVRRRRSATPQCAGGFQEERARRKQERRRAASPARGRAGAALCDRK